MFGKALKGQTGIKPAKMLTTLSLEKIQYIVKNNKIDETILEDNRGEYSVTFKTESPNFTEINRINLDKEEYTLVKWVLEDKKYKSIISAVNMHYILLLKKFVSQCAKDKFDLLTKIKNGQIGQNAINKLSLTELEHNSCEQLLNELNNLIEKNKLDYLVFTSEERILIDEIQEKRHGTLGMFTYHGASITHYDGTFKIFTDIYWTDVYDTQECTPNVHEVPIEYTNLNKFCDIVGSYYDEEKGLVYSKDLIEEY